MLVAFRLGQIGDTGVMDLVDEIVVSRSVNAFVLGLESPVTAEGGLRRDVRDPVMIAARPSPTACPQLSLATCIGDGDNGRAMTII